MPKIPTSTALKLYEEDLKIAVAISAPEKDPNWNDWYEYGFYFFNNEFEKYEAQKAEIDENDENCSDSEENEESVTHTKSSNFSRCNRRISNKKAKKKLKRNAQIANSSYYKRAEDIMHLTSKVAGKTKVCMHNHPIVRANRLIKTANKIS